MRTRSRPLFESVPPKSTAAPSVSSLPDRRAGPAGPRGHVVRQWRLRTVPVGGRCPRSLWNERPQGFCAHHLRLVEMVAREADRFDVIHFHLDYVHFPACSGYPAQRHDAARLPLSPDEEASSRPIPSAAGFDFRCQRRHPTPIGRRPFTGMPLDLHTFQEKPGAISPFGPYFSRERTGQGH